MATVNDAGAAEMIRHTDAGWNDSDQKQFEHLLTDVFYPIIRDFYPTANGDWDAAMTQTMLAMGVFLDDWEMFQRAVDYYLDGQGNGAICNYINEFGECQESGRDQAHTQMGLGYLGCAVYHHYHDRMGLEMPFTGQVVEKIRPERWQTAYVSWGTLMHAGQPVPQRDKQNGGENR